MVDPRMPEHARERCPSCRYSLDDVLGAICPECGTDAIVERRWAAFGLPAWPIVGSLAGGALAWLALLAFTTWLVRTHTGVARGDAPAVALLGMLLALSGVAIGATMLALTSRSRLRRTVGLERARLRLLSLAPLVGAGLSWVGVVGASLLA